MNRRPPCLMFVPDMSCGTSAGRALIIDKHVVRKKVRDPAPALRELAHFKPFRTRTRTRTARMRNTRGIPALSVPSRSAGSSRVAGTQ